MCSTYIDIVESLTIIINTFRGKTMATITNNHGNILVPYWLYAKAELAPDFQGWALRQNPSNNVTLYIGLLDDVPDDFGPIHLICELSLQKTCKAKAFVSGCNLEMQNIIYKMLEDGILSESGEKLIPVKKSDSCYMDIQTI